MNGDRPAASQPFEPLSQRERDILALLAQDLTDREIAERLVLAYTTIKWYNRQIFNKLGVSNREDAVEQATTLGLLFTPSDTLLDVGKHNLPPQATPFVGRHNELNELAALLNHPTMRLITILAPGGMGKTRMVLEVARQQVGRYTDGVFFVPLAPLSVAGDIVTTIAKALDFSFYGEHPPATQLIDFLSDRSLLLVLDNFEHLLDGTPLVASMLAAAPRLRIVTTSRERLNLQGETVYALRGLDFPTRETPEDALEFEAVTLFMQSAHRVRPDFYIEAVNLDYLARLCRLTGGMPLGIELAAGWIDVLSLEQIAAELQRGLDILETELRDVPERQRSIRATFERTWERLTDEEQRVFMRLSVFRGGFTVEAARMIADADLRLLRRLVNKALVQPVPDGRHDIHELLRQFAAEKLSTSGEQASIQARHAAVFADFMTERNRDIRTNRQVEALTLIDLEFENMRAAWLYTIDEQMWNTLPKFLYSLWFYLAENSLETVGIDLLEYAVKALQSSPISTESELALGRVLAHLGSCYSRTGHVEKSFTASDEALRILRQHDSPDDLCAALITRQDIADSAGQWDISQQLSQEGLQLAHSLGDQFWEAQFLFFAANSSILHAQVSSALQYAQVALEINEARGDRLGIMNACDILCGGNVELKQAEQAKRWLARALLLLEGFKHSFSTARIYHLQARIELLERNYGAAHRTLRFVLRFLADTGRQSFFPYVLIFFAQLFAEQNRPERAVQILATIDGFPMAHTTHHGQALRDELQATLEPERFAAAWAYGQEQELSTLVSALLAEQAQE